MSRKHKDKYVDLKINGRLFPSWILHNFKPYKLPEIVKADDDPCFRKSKLELRKYQLFLSKFMDYNSPYHDVLIYHGVGSGKTSSTINIYNMLYNYTPGWNVFLLLKASLKGSTWMGELSTWLSEEEKKFRFENIVFISYDAPNADKAFLDAIKNADSSKKSLYIIEEAHNFIRNVYSNISTRQGRRAQTIYDYIIQDKKENEGTRVIALSGTPAINKPFELALLFNMLRPGIFPKSELQFNQEYISTSAYQTLSTTHKNNFQRRIMGLVSFYIGATPDFFASKKIEYIDVEMSSYQDDIYTYFEGIEDAIARKKRSKMGGSTTYKSYTRQSCNFVFPHMNQNMTGELRPRPTNFKISEKDGQRLINGEETSIEKGTDKYYNVQQYVDSITEFVKTFDRWLAEKDDEDQKNKYTILDDVESYSKKYKGDYAAFHKNEKKKSGLYNALHMCSAKFLNVIFITLKSKGPVLVYTNYVLMEGLQIFKIYLKYFGFTAFQPSDAGKEGLRYSEYHGGIDMKERGKNLTYFNDVSNKYGKISKIMMISPAGAEGLNLSNIRQIHLMEPYWHEVRMIQMIGRGVRFCSHRDLPKEERHVDVYRYKSVRKSGKWTTDQYIEDMARGKEGLIQSFLDAIKEVAVDCALNKTHNALVQDYKCFQFEEPSLFDEQIGPAYKEDLYDDLKMDNGSNSVNSQTMRIKVIKIVAVKQLTKDDGTTKVKYSKSNAYWYNPATGIVYDYELHYAIGKVGYDADNLPKKLDKDTYIIDKMIPIPMIEGDDE
jgi:superfamily II DNA or RNA helicase